MGREERKRLQFVGEEERIDRGEKRKERKMRKLGIRLFLTACHFRLAKIINSSNSLPFPDELYSKNV